VTGPGGPGAGGDAQPGTVQVIVQGARTRVVLAGEVDADLGPELAEAMADAEATGLPVDVDVERVTFMDSSGIAFLARLATRSDDRVRLLRPPDTVRFLLEVTRIGELLDVVDDAPSDGTADAADSADDGDPTARVPDHGLPTIGLGRRPGGGGDPDDVA